MKRYVALITLFAILAGLLTLGESVKAAKSKAPAAAVAPDRFGTPVTCEMFGWKGCIGKFDRLRKTPRWTVECLTPQSVKGNAERSGAFFEPPDTPVEFRPTLGAYHGSGYDRGHCAPAGNYLSSQKAQDATFTLANMSPQNPELNRGLWKDLEHSVRQIAEDGATVWVATIPLYEPRQVPSIYIGGGDEPVIWVPSGYAKAILVQPAASSSPKYMRAWIVGNFAPKDGATPDDYRVTTDEVERRAGMDLWAELPEETQLVMEAVK